DGWLGKNGRRETGDSGPVALAAHLDTVFGADVNVTVERRGQRLEGPGISDNARGLAALVAVAEAMVAARVPATRPVLFAATVGEEGSGDLRGVKYLLNGKHSVGAQHAAPLPNATGLPGTPAAFIALDGAGLDRVIPRALAQLDVTVRAALERAADDENRRRTATSPALRVEVQLLGDRPSGMTPRAHPLVQAAVAANRALGRDADLASASTDANVPIALGIPAIALGAGGKAGDAHLASEWYENVEGALGIVRALLVTATMAEVV